MNKLILIGKSLDLDTIKERIVSNSFYRGGKHLVNIEGHEYRVSSLINAIRCVKAL